jgi:hypothetical protein
MVVQFSYLAHRFLGRCLKFTPPLKKANQTPLPPRNSLEAKKPLHPAGLDAVRLAVSTGGIAACHLAAAVVRIHARGSVTTRKAEAPL